jgi:hypothetical protein
MNMMSTKALNRSSLFRSLMCSLVPSRASRRGLRLRRDLASASWQIAAEILEERSMLSAPTLDWGFSLGTTSGSSTVNSTAVDTAGDVYVAGVVTHGTVDLDPGSGTANVTANNQTGFVAKYDPTGKFLWVETFSSDTSVNAFSLAVGSSGGVYVAGGFQGTTTFGVGESNSATLVNQGGCNSNGFLAKLDQSTGHVDWVDGVLGNLPLAANSVRVASSGDVFFAGQAASGTITITDGKTGATLKSFSNSASNYVARLDTNGGVTWAEGFAEGNASIVAGNGLAVDGSGNVYLAGALYGKNVDFDPGSGSYILSRTARTSNVFVVKLDDNGVFQWATKDDNSSRRGTSASSLAVDGSGNAYVTIQQQSRGWGWGWGGDGGVGGWGGWGGWNGWGHGQNSSSSGQQSLARIDSSGNWQWTQVLDRTKPSKPSCQPNWTQPDCAPVSPPPSGGDHEDHWSHGNEHSVWSPPVVNSGNWSHGSGGQSSYAPAPTVSNTTAKVTIDNQGNAVVVSARSGATAYSPTDSVVWSTTTPLPVTDVAASANGNIVYIGMFNNKLNINPDGTDTIDSNTRWRTLAPFIAQWKTS